MCGGGTEVSGGGLWLEEQGMRRDRDMHSMGGDGGEVSAGWALNSESLG